MSEAFAKSDAPYDSTALNKRLPVFLILFGLFALLFDLGGRTIENKDYVRYAEVAREIYEFNDWTVLRLDGEIYVDKPPLHFWMIAVSFKLFGVTAFAARFPAAIAAFGGLLIAFFFGRKLFRSPEIGFLSAVILLAVYGYFWWARRTRIDMAFATFFSLSLFFFDCGLEEAQRKRKAFWYMAFWLATGCAFMEKAFIAFSNLAVVTAYGISVALKQQDRRFSPGILALTSLFAALPILPWLISLLNHPEFNNYHDTLLRYTIMTRSEGFFYYFKELPLKLLPATPFLFLGLWGYVRFRPKLPERRGLSFLLLWIGIYFFVLHLTAAKNQRYLLPIFLPCSVVSAWAIIFFLKSHTAVFGRIMRWTDAVMLGVAAVSLLSPFYYAYHYGFSLLTPIPYVCVMGIALVLVRKYLPLKVAGFFVSCIFVLSAIEVGDGLSSQTTSVYMQISRNLNLRGVSPGQIAFHECSSRVQGVLAFYYNRFMPCSDDLDELVGDPKVRAIVTRKLSDNKSTLIRQQVAGEIISLDRDYSVILKAK